MGRAPAAPRLRAVHALCPGSLATPGRIRRDHDPACGRHFPADFAPAPECPAVFSRTADAGRCGVLRTAGSGTPSARSTGPKESLYTGIYMFRSQAVLIAIFSLIANAAG